ncbi:hypothetical protein C5167_042462 [Papaver somniferum]|uniref:Hexosyltransferase n=1 Tax=Papaver somniferum TaxID=3469 RepID=A0A4Y7L2V8_PAPSO|nr:hypothetical protein C5167_042462 [Papaver somniferum]
MLWVMKLSGFISAAMVMIIFSPSLQSFPPAVAIRSSSSSSNFDSDIRFSFRKSSVFQNGRECVNWNKNKTVCDPSLVHIAITLDIEYLREIKTLVSSTFPELNLKIYNFNPEIVKNLISSSVRQALEQPLNYARNYLSDILESCVERVIYLDSDLIVVDDVYKLWVTELDSKTVGAPEYCHANLTKYFTSNFWSNERYYGTFNGRKPCYFNAGVMVIDLKKWRRLGFTKRIEKWMKIQKIGRIYELGSLPPFLLVFGGYVAPIEHRWNQHGLGGDNVRGSCRDPHSGPVSLLHWSGSGKPWLRLDSHQPCPLDALWAPYDLYGTGSV